MFDTPAPRILNIQSGASFVDTLAQALLSQFSDNPIALSSVRVLLPTRRACRALSEAFLRISDGQAVLLPRLTPLGDIDEDELSISELDVIGDAASGTDLPPAIAGTQRQLLLARAIMAMPQHRMQPEQATGLASELAKLLDQLATEDSDPAKLRDLVPEDYATHWQEVLQFLEILISKWPDILANEGALDPAARRNALLRGQATVWQSAPPSTPIIAAGSTGSIPATAELLSVIAGLPQGAVILPGLDTALDDAAWEQLGPTHPQYGLQQLLKRLGIARAHVIDMSPSGTSTNRTEVLSLALRPASSGITDIPNEQLIREDLAGTVRINCPSPSDEATVVSLIMRRTLETPGETCALITPDRNLARRVAAALGRWGIGVDDSAGTPLMSTPPAAFLRLLSDAVLRDLAPIPLLALLKHPLAAGGMPTADFRDLVRALDKHALRGPRPAPGFDGLRTAIGNRSKHARLRKFVDQLEDIIEPLVVAMRASSVDYSTLAKLHIETAERLAATDEEDGAHRIWAGEAGEVAALFASELMDTLSTLGPQPPRQYHGVFERLMTGRAVRPKYGAHPRLFIWGLLEARLQHADTIILGGLNEGTWPPQSETNPWMSRPMLTDMGLEPPERRIGLTAHDFQQAFAAPRVYLTRAEKVGGTPTVPSRWLLRIDNVLERAGAKSALDIPTTESWLSWAAAMDTAPHVPEKPPKPCPPTSARPTELSVTRIETLIRDPYSIYARYVLGLRPLDDIDADPGAAERGTMVHSALDAFIRTYPDHVPENAKQHLMTFGQHAFGELLNRPGVRAFWWPRFERIADWFLEWQRQRIAEGWRTVLSEETGAISIDAVAGGFKITAKPDRIDFREDIGLAILDYKTGSPPNKKQVNSGLSPQLPLEALIAMAGNFENLPSQDVQQLMYVQLSGGRLPGKELNIDLDITELTEKTIEGVNRLLTRFANPETPYTSRPRPQFESRFGDYDHLARVAAWRGVEGSDE
jgi:ATP-dependent helicase/nuclease subunit B